MNPSKLSKSILERIEQEKIIPRSRTFFIAKNIGFWSLFALAMIVGAMSFALTLYAANHTDFSVTGFVPEEEVLEHWLTLLPTIWIFALGVATGIGIFGLKHTKRGYRIALLALISSNVVGSALLGGGLYAAGGGEIIEEVIEEHVEMYEGVREKHQRFWGNPERTGRLAGRIQSLDEEAKTLTLEDPHGRTWEVDYSETKLPKDIELEPGKLFKMRGEANAEGSFKPEALKPARRQEHVQKRVEHRLKKNPELRRQFEKHLSPETKEQLETLKENNQRPSRELREQMREEVKANTTPEQRQELRENMRESIKSERPPNRNARLQKAPRNNRP